ncbi:MAG: zinc ribbon domain-containing protein [archaeon]|nr:zinc ribbon domain-containing protein [archaeon]
MSDINENYCKLLGINPYKEYNEQAIRTLIAKAEEEWRRDLSTQTTQRRTKYLLGEWLRLLPDIRSVMDSPILREEQFETARKILERKCSKLRREAIILHNGDVVIPPTVAEKMAERLEWKGIDGKTVIRASKLNAVPFPRPINNVVSNAFRMMQDVGAYSPVELINSLIDMPEMDFSINKVDENSSPDDLRLVYDTVNRRLNNMKNGRIPNLDAYVQAVRSVKVNLNSDDTLRQLVEYGKCMRILEPAFEQMDEDAGNQFSRIYIDNLLTEYVNDTDANADLCLSLLEDYCIRRLFPANFSISESALGVCPRCKSMIYTGDNCYFCTSCGSAINNICPACGRGQSAANRNCVGCGIDILSALEVAHKAYADIKEHISAGYLDKANRELEELAKTYPSYEHNAKIRARIHENSYILNMIVDRIYTDFRNKAYFGVKNTCVTEGMNFPLLIEREDIKPRFEEACRMVSEADALCIEANSKNPEESKELYIRASEICPDHPDAVANLRRYPPEGPADAEVQAVGDLQLALGRPDSQADQSTIPLDETEGWVYTDKTAEPGIEYYYRIYAKRWGILSQDYAECGPQIIVREVTNVRIEPEGDGLKLTYLFPPGSVRVRIWRKESGSEEGDEVELLHNNNGTVIDEGLKGGCIYHYLFVAEYEQNGNISRSYGTTFTGITASLPQPINDLSVRWDRRSNSYVAKWTGPQEDVELYYSTVRDAVPGENVSIKDLSVRMTRIEPLGSEDGTFRFHLPEATVIYICPAITVGNSTIRGRECVIANLRPFRNLTREIEGDECRLTMEWPVDAEYARATIRGRNPDGEPTLSMKEIGRAEYEEQGGFRFPLNGTYNTTVNIHAVYEIEGEKRESIGLCTEIFSGTYSKVRYTVDTEGVKGDRKKTRVVVSFDCADETVVPRCIMVMSEEGIPLRQKDGEVIWESDDPVVLTDGKAECGFVIPKDEASVRNMRLFFPNRNDYNKYRFVHPVYRRD